MGNRADILEWLMGSNPMRESSFCQRPVHMFDNAVFAGQSSWMKYTESDSVFEKRPVCNAVEREEDGAVWLSLDFTFPAEINFMVSAISFKLDMELIFSGGYRKVFDLRRDSVPILISNRRVNSAKCFMAADKEISQEGVFRFEYNFERPCLEMNWFRTHFIPYEFLSVFPAKHEILLLELGLF